MMKHSLIFDLPTKWLVSVPTVDLQVKCFEKHFNEMICKHQFNERGSVKSVNIKLLRPCVAGAANGIE